MDAKPADDQSVTPAEAPPPQTLAAWFRQNAVQLAVVAAVLGVVCYFLNPLDVLLAGFGLSLIVFIHELGHFAAAKLCDVHVKTFSIGFGPALPFCSFKYGETTYKLAMIPLGGFVAMVGEGDTEGDVVDAEDPPVEHPEDPRSFRNKPVWQRMVIISAGVIMNVLLGAVLFVVTYLHGVEEQPAVLAHVEPGSAAWRAGLHVGTEIKALNGREGLFFDDIKPTVQSTSKGEAIELVVNYRGEQRTVTVEPLKQEGAPYPMLGIGPPRTLTLRYFRRDDTPPYAVGSPAEAAKSADGGPGLKPGDRIVAMSDPRDPSVVTPLDPNWNGLPGEVFDYEYRLARLAGKPVTFHVVRRTEGGPTTVTPVAVSVPPGYRKDLGLRMQMGPVAAVRRGSPAERAGVRARQNDGSKELAPGDQIASVELPEAGGKVTRFTADKIDAASPPTQTVRPLDPLRLPFELDQWAEHRPAGAKVTVTVLRAVGHEERKPVPLELDWDDSYRYESSSYQSASTPVPVNGLGLAYHVQTVVADVAPNSPASAEVQPNDLVKEVRYKVRDHNGKETTGSWNEVSPHQWALVDHNLQRVAPHACDLKVVRQGQTVEVSLTAVDDTTWPLADRGLDLTPDTRIQKADGIAQALDMGAHRTVRMIKTIYQNLYAMVFGRVSVKVMAGPITLARASYLIAGEDVWHLLLLMAMISINLAVVNFLPIPVLDGGHMVFLGYEAVRGKPAPESVQAVLTYIGVGMVVCLMFFVIGLDIWRLFWA